MRARTLSQEALHRILAAIIGGEERAIRKRALTIDVRGTRIRVLHPFDVLRTRVVTLHLLKSRARDTRYVAQAKLVVRVLHAYSEPAGQLAACR